MSSKEEPRKEKFFLTYHILEKKNNFHLNFVGIREIYVKKF